MGQSIDTGKASLWQKRLARFDCSGLTIAEFCRNEGLALHCFYYWNKRLKSDQVRRPARGSFENEGVTKEVTHARTGMVRFNWGSALQISVPANCVDAIQCVLAHISQEQSAGRGTEAARSFQQLILSDQG